MFHHKGSKNAKLRFNKEGSESKKNKQGKLKTKYKTL